MLLYPQSLFGHPFRPKQFSSLSWAFFSPHPTKAPTPCISPPASMGVLRTPLGPHLMALGLSGFGKGKSRYKTFWYVNSHFGGAEIAWFCNSENIVATPVKFFLGYFLCLSIDRLFLISSYRLHIFSWPEGDKVKHLTHIILMSLFPSFFSLSSGIDRDCSLGKSLLSRSDCLGQ